MTIEKKMLSLVEECGVKSSDIAAFGHFPFSYEQLNQFFLLASAHAAERMREKAVLTCTDRNPHTDQWKYDSEFVERQAILGCAKAIENLNVLEVLKEGWND